VWCFVKVNEETILVGCVYRPPLADGGISHEISKSIGYASHLCKADSSKHLLVASDFNFPGIKWIQDGGYCNKGRPSSLEFLNVLSKNFLTQHVLEPIFKSNILDLIVTDDPGRIFSITTARLSAPQKKTAFTPRSPRTSACVRNSATP